MLANYRIVNGELRHSDDELYHKKFKYTYKVKRNGKWVYYYNGDEKNAKTGRALIGNPERYFISKHLQRSDREINLARADKKETKKANAMDALYKKTNSWQGKLQSKVNNAIGDVRIGAKKASKQLGYAKYRTKDKIVSEKGKFKKDPEGYVKNLLGKATDSVKDTAGDVKKWANKTASQIKKESAETIDKAEKWINNNLLTKTTVTGGYKPSEVNPKTQSNRMYFATETTTSTTKLGKAVNKLKKKKKGNTYRTDRMR